MKSALTKTQKKFLQTYGELQPSSRFSYITIHPLADEADILSRLRLPPDKCVVCDLYWAVGKRLAFVSIWSDTASSPSVRFWKEQDKTALYKFSVTTKFAPLTSVTVEQILHWLDQWLNSSDDLELEAHIESFQVTKLDIGCC